MPKAVFFQQIMTTKPQTLLSFTAGGLEEGTIYLASEDAAGIALFDIELTPKEAMKLISELYAALGQAA